MIRPIRLVAGWSIALAAALLLNLALPPPTAAPSELALRPDAASPGASARATATSAPIDRAGSFRRPVPPGGGNASGSGSAGRSSLRSAPSRQPPCRRLPSGRASPTALHSLAIGVSVDGTAGWTGASGVAMDGLTLLDGSSPFAIASITKTFTAALVLQLVGGRAPLPARRGDGAAAGRSRSPPASRSSTCCGTPPASRTCCIPLRDRLNGDIDRLWQPAEVLAGVPGAVVPRPGPRLPTRTRTTCCWA